MSDRIPAFIIVKSANSSKKEFDKCKRQADKHAEKIYKGQADRQANEKKN